MLTLTQQAADLPGQLHPGYVVIAILLLPLRQSQCSCPKTSDLTSASIPQPAMVRVSTQYIVKCTLIIALHHLRHPLQFPSLST